jgi:hypothetical protein
VVPTFPTNEPRAAAFTAQTLVGQGNLQRGFHRLAAGVGEENPVEPLRRNARQPRGQFKGLGVPHLERRRKVHLLGLRLDGRRDGLAVVPRIHAPKARHAVQNLPPAVVPVMHALRPCDQARALLESPVGGERHPVVLVVHGGSFEP